MATIEQLKQALVLADQAGDFENASVLAAAIKQQMEAEKAQIVPQRPGEKAPEFKEYSPWEKVIGVVESDLANITGLTTGAIGALSGTMFGIGESVANGTYGTKEGAELAERRANEAAARFTYEPKTPAGQEITERVGKILTNAMAFGPKPEIVTGDIGAAASAASPYLKAKSGQAIQGVKNISKPIVEVTKPIVEKTKNVFKEKLPTKPDEVAAEIYKASKGDKKAKEIIKKIAPLDEEALKAAERLDIDLPIDIYLTNDETAKTVGLSRSQVGSAEEMAFKHDIINTSQVADEALNQLGKVTDVASVSDDVKSALQATRSKLKEQENILYKSFDDTLPPEQTIVAENLFDLLSKTAEELGGEARLTATEKNLLALSKAENLTYGALLRAKNDIGSAVGGQKTLFPDVNDFQLKKIYDAIREDQKAAVSLFGGEDQLANLKLANTLTVKRKAIENSIIQGYGRKGQGSIAGLVNRAITAGSKGDVAPLDKLLSVVPVEMHKDVVATALKDLSTSKKAVNLGEFDFANYAKTYEGLRKNAPVYSKIINILGTDKAQMLQDLYTISKKIVEAKSNVLHTGKANQAIIAGLKGNTIMQNIVGKIIGWGTSKISAGLISPDFMFKTPQDKLQAIADLMRNPDFKQMMIEASNGKASAETVNKVMATDAYKRAAVGESTEPIIVEEVKPATKQEVKEAVKEKVEAKKEEKKEPKKPSAELKEAMEFYSDKEQIKAKIKAKKEEKEGKKKVSTEQQEARDLHKEVKSNQYLETYKDLILDEGKAKTKGERNQSHNWFDVPVEDDFGQTVATKRIAGQRDITEAFTADSAAINRFMNGKATVEDLRAINHDLKTFEMSSDLRDEAAMKKANKTNESVELSDGSIYDPFSKMTYSKKEWQDLMNEAMFSKSKPNERLAEWHKDSAPETKNEDGSPKVFYHGTNKSFDTFDIEKSNVGNYGTGFYFGENAEAISKHFADKPNSNIMPAYLKADNLFDATKINKPLVEDYLKSINAEGFTPNYEIRPFLFYKSIMSLKGTESFKKFIQSKGYDGIIGQTPAVGKQIVVFSPNQIKSVFNKGTFSESNPNILFSKGYSNLEETIKNFPQEKLTKEQLLGTKTDKNGNEVATGILKDIKADEMKYSGMQSYIDSLPEGAKITKAELLDAINQPKLEKVVKGYDRQKGNLIDRLYNQKKDTLKAFKDAKKEWLKENPQYADLAPFESGDIFAKTELGKKLYDEYNSASEHYLEAAEGSESISDTKFESYKTKDVGTNYREVLTTIDGKKLSGDFKSAHWDEPNVLYHTRLQDVKMGNEKALLVDEIQSDLHQKGRSEGYINEKDILDEKNKVAQMFYKKDFSYLNNKQIKEVENYILTAKSQNLGDLNKGVPQAPYSKTWHEKAMKDVIQEAVDNGYDRVAWTVGKTQADRYNLAKYIDELHYYKHQNGKYSIEAYKDNYNTINKQGLSEEELANFIGKETAAKIIAGEKTDIANSGRNILSGVDLEVGGEGMKGFYDKILPDWTSKYIKKYGSKVEKTRLSNGDEVWTFKITDAMREDIGKKGQALYSSFKTKNATTVEKAKQIAKKLLGKHYAKHADTFEIVQSIDDLPQNIKDALYSIQAYHGTPHNVDKFSTKYIGTGEGAQAYGYGLYFAGDKEIAKWYRDNVNADFMEAAKSELKRANGDFDIAIQNTKEQIKHLESQDSKSSFLKNHAEFQRNKLADLEAMKRGEKKQGKLYKVELKLKQEELLDWDKPLSQQSDYVKEKLGIKENKAETDFLKYQDEMLEKYGGPRSYFKNGTDAEKAKWQELQSLTNRDSDGFQTGKQFYESLTQEKRSDKAASESLNSLGIKGIKYLDATSRNTSTLHITPPERTVSGKWMVKSNDYNSKGVHFDTEAEAKAYIKSEQDKANSNYVIFADEDIGKPEVLMSGGKPRGIFDPKTGKAYIIADAMKSNEVEGVILHELLHKNINNEVKAGKSRAEAIMGSRYESVVKRLDNLYKMGDKQVKEAFQKVTDANTPAQHRIEEVMTYLLENITNESKPLLIKWKDDVIQAIKAFIAKVSLQLGMKAETVMSKLDSKDIANILRSEAIKNQSMLKNIKR